MARKRHFRAGERGAAAAETALALPYVIFLILGAAAFAFLLLQRHAVTDYLASSTRYCALAEPSNGAEVACVTGMLVLPPWCSAPNINIVVQGDAQVLTTTTTCNYWTGVLPALTNDAIGNAFTVVEQAAYPIFQ